MNDILRDLQFGLRLLFKERVVTFVAIVTLGLGIGATTPIVSLVGSVLLRPFPHLAHPTSLVWVFETKGTEIDFAHEQVTPGNFARWKEQSTQFESLAALVPGADNVMGPSGPERVSRASVSANYFGTLGVRPALGRDFEVGEDTAGRDHVVILGHAYWQHHFAANPNAIGQKLSVGGTPRTIVGVMPPECGFPAPSDIWIPLVIDVEMRESRSNASIIALGRLKSGASLAAVNAELATIATQLAAAFPETNRGKSARAERIGDLFVGPFRAVDIVILICAALTLVVASVNVGNVLLAQGTRRRAEVALRSALGATRWRIVRQLLTESFLLCTAGGVAGLLLSMWALDAFRTTMPPGVARQVALLADLSVDSRWIAVSAGMTLGTMLLAGLWPALRLAETRVAPTLKEQGQQATPSSKQRRLSKVLVTAQVSIALAMLTGAVSAAVEVDRAEHARLGFDPKGVLTGQLVRSGDTSSTGFYRDLVAHLRVLPGVKSVGLVSSLPLRASDDTTAFPADRPTPSPGEMPSFRLTVVEGDYLDAIGTTLVAGRPLTQQDSANAPAVAMLSRRAATRLFSTEAAVGKRILLDQNPPCSVVAVVDDVMAIGDTDQGTVYVPLAQRPRAHMIAVLRTPSAPLVLEGPLRDVAASLDRNQPVSEIRPLEVVVDESLWMRRTLARLLTMMGGVATVLALVGIYGMAAYSVGQRRAELGIRAALGATPRKLVSLVLEEAVWIGGVGSTIGFVLSLLIVSALSQATDRRPLSPAWNVALALLLFVVVLAASYGPARRAGRIPPSLAMKNS